MKALVKYSRGHGHVEIRDMSPPSPGHGEALVRVSRAGLCPKHNPELATLIHFAASVPNTGPYLEFPARVVTYDDWYDPKFTIQEGGKIAVPTGPGLGINYDDAIWREAAPRHHSIP